MVQLLKIIKLNKFASVTFKLKTIEIKNIIMLTFLNTVILGALAAAVIPLLIHLFNRQKTKLVNFPSLRFLKMMEKQRLRNLKIYQYLLILVRTLIIATLVLVFARPAFKDFTFWRGDASAPITAVIILDSGLNMKKSDLAGERFVFAREMVLNLLDTFSPDDKVFVIPSHQPRLLLTEPNEISNLNSSYLSGRWNDALQSAQNIFESHPNFNRELYLVSDFKFPESEIASLAALDENIRRILVPVNSSGSINISVDTFYIAGTFFEVNKPVEVFSRLNNHSQTARNVSVNLFINDKRVAQNRISLKPGETRAIDLNYQPVNSGFQQGFVEIDDDDLLADNRYYFNLFIPEKINVLFVDDIPSVFLENALKTINDNTNIRITFSPYGTWAGLEFDNFDVICLSNFPVLSEPYISRLKTFQKQNGGLVMIPGPALVPADFNRNYGALFNDLKITRLVSTSGTGQYFTLKPFDPRSPVFEGLFKNSEPEVNSPRIKQYFKFILPPAATRSIDLNNGDAFVFGLERALFWSGYFNPDWSDFHLKGLFVPLLAQSFRRAIPGGFYNEPPVYCGREVIIDLPQTDGEIELYYQRSGQEKILFNANDFSPQFGSVQQKFEQPGNYSIFNQNKIIKMISVNPDASYLSGPHADPEILAAAKNTHIVRDNSQLADVIRGLRFGTELWQYLLALTMLLIIAEIILIKKSEGFSLRKDK